VHLVGFCYKNVAAIGFATIKFVCRHTVSSLHPNNGLENIPILYLPLFNSITTKIFLDIKNIVREFAPSPLWPPCYLYGTKYK
jgi:hypothetical protein